MTAPVSPAAVRIGGYSLEVGTDAGSFARFEPDQETENADPLEAALAEEPGEQPGVVAAVEGLQEGAAAVTDRIEEAEKLLRDATAGQLLEVGNLTGEIDSLLDLLGRLDKAGRFEEELRLMRSLNGLLVLALRWLDLVRSLRSLLGSARAAGHQAGQAWAHHELGSLHLCAGEPRKASEHLREALRMEEQLGVLAGQCATRHNLDSAERDLAVSRGGGGQPPRRLLRWAGLAAAFAVLGAGGGVGIALAISDGGPGSSTTHALTVELAGPGTGTVSGAGIACPTECTAAVVDGQTMTLTATPGAGSLLGGWEGVDCDRRKPCSVTPTGDLTATAVFVRAADRRPPTTPTGLRATAVNAGEIDLSWLKSTDNVAVTGYVVYRNGARLRRVSGTTTVFQDRTVAASTSYLYAVRAVDARGNASALSDTARATTPGTSDTEAPTTPTGLRATAVDAGEIDLSWLKSTDNVAVTGYVVYRNGAKLATVSGSTTVFQDTTVAAGTGYVYVVRATDAAGNLSASSGPAKATTPAVDTEPPSAPANLDAKAANPYEIDLSWSASSDNVGVTGYVIFRGGAELTTVSGSTTVFQDTAVSPSTGYVYTVKAVDAAGNASPESKTKASTPAALR